MLHFDDRRVVAATATPMRNGSASAPSSTAISTAIGAAMTAVAVLFMMSDRVMVTTISSARTRAGDQPAASVTMPSAMIDVAPVVSRAATCGRPCRS